MTEKPKISLIIPVFNAASTLEASIKSVLDQSYEPVEVILVNDGSTDGSKKIMEKFSRLNPRIININIKNSGPGKARNEGIKICSGDYICFLDADDLLMPDALENMMENLLNSQSELVIGNHETILLNGKKLPVKRFEKNILSSNEAIEALLKFKIIPTTWGKLFKSSIAKQISFPGLYWKEDDVFLLKYLQKIRKVSLMNKVVIKNFVNPNSLTRQTLSEKMITDTFHSFHLQSEYVPDQLQNLLLEKQLLTLIDYYLLYIADREDIRNAGQIFNLLKKYLENIYLKKHVLSLKKKFWIVLLHLQNYFGEKAILFILKILKYKRFSILKKLRN